MRPMSRTSQVLGLAAAFMVLASEGKTLAGDQPVTAPNVILVLTDDQGFGDLSCHGSPDVRTPNIDRLHRESVRFTDFQASPTCSPTRAAIMTGYAPFKGGVTHTIHERERLVLKYTTIAQQLKALGYATGIFGKWHLGDEDAYQPGRRGFDEVFVHGAGGIGQRFSGSAADAPDNTYFSPVIRHNGTFVRTRGFCTDVFFRQALGWIKQQQKDARPFFAYISTNAPHSPYVAPDKYTKRFAAAGYGKAAQGDYGMVENIDDNMGLLMRKLDEWNLSGNTVLIFMSDNGKAQFRNKEPLGRNAVPDTYNAGMKGYKGSVNEGGTRVPLFVRWPGRMTAGTDVPAMASHYDIFPTLIEMAGGRAPEAIDGRSLVPLIQGRAADWSGMTYRFVHKGRWNPGENPDDYKYQTFAVRNERFRLINNEELYDVKVDRGEQDNVIKLHPEVAQKMMAAYNAWWDEVRPQMVNESGGNEILEPPYVLEYNRQTKARGIPEWMPPEL